MSDNRNKMRLLSLLARPTPQILQYVVLFAILIYVFVPLLWLFITAISTNPGPYLKFPEGITFRHLFGIMTNKPVGSGSGTAYYPAPTSVWIRNSLLMSSVSMAVNIVCASLASYALSRLQIKGKGLLMTILLLAGFMPNAAKMLPLFKLCQQLGLLNNLVGVGVVVASESIGMQIWIMKGFFDNIPRDLEEQAWVYGCSRLKTLFKVVMPAAGPGLAVIAFLSFMKAWGAFTIPLILLRKDSLFPIAIGLSSVLVHTTGEVGLNVDYGSICALAVLYSIPSITIYYVFKKHLMSIRLSKIEVL